jgi:hypothetical protein
MSGIGLDDIDRLTAGRLGTYDTPCPVCGPGKRRLASQRKRTLRVWRIEPGFATFFCARCGEGGWVSDRNSHPVDDLTVKAMRAEMAARQAAHRTKRKATALWLWGRRCGIHGSPVSTYLREVRRISGPLPATLGYLPAWRDHPPSMIAAVGLAHEVEPGVLAIDDAAIRGVHITRLRPDGSGKASGGDAKITIGISAGAPIVLAPMNDLLGLAIVEGIEDGLSVHEATGLGVWASGGAARMRALAPAIPSYTDAVSVLADDDADGRRGAHDLVAAVLARGIHAQSIEARALS